MANKILVGAQVLLMVCLCTGMKAQSPPAAPQPGNIGAGATLAAPANSGDTGGSNAVNRPDYVIGADDTLHVSVWKEPDLTATLPVRSDGKISLPLLNDVQAAGLTPMQLADSITVKLKKFIADPRVTVVVTGMNSQRIFVTGEVLHSGAMPLLPNMTMLQALSAAGFNQFSNVKGIYLLRTENGKQLKLPFNYKEVVKGRHPEENIQLRPGDTVVVP
ncbi:MAG TPA: polysaccharide biosynthesis/export family protein [Candidatus Sulfotelmatobacter sp.]